MTINTSGCPSVHSIEEPDGRTTDRKLSLRELARIRLQGQKSGVSQQQVKEDECLNPSQRQIAFLWFETAISEGHIEPAQPHAGRAVGWPVRSFYMRSLLVDFQCFCMRKGLSEEDPERDAYFMALARRFFQVEGDLVRFPSLAQCRKRLKIFQQSSS